MEARGEFMTEEEEVSLSEKQDGSIDNYYYLFPDICQLKNDEVLENEFVFREARFSGAGTELAVEGIHLWYHSIKFSEKCTWLVKNNFPRVLMNFNLEGNTTYYSNKLESIFVQFSAGQHNLMLIPEGNIQMQCLPSEHSEIFSLSLSTDFFFDTLPASQRLFQHFQKGVSYQLPAFMSLRNLPVTSQMGHILFEIINCQYKGHLKSLFVKAKTLELLILQMEQYEHLPLPDIASNLKSENVDQIMLVKKLLDENLDQQWSLKDLAHRAGTNQFNLKKYFKEVLGQTVFGYLHQKRMETAKNELCRPGSSVNEVAHRMGYKHATHFSAAFKKYFGILPTKFRIGLLHLMLDVAEVSMF